MLDPTSATLNVQTSTDLKTWSLVPPASNQSLAPTAGTYTLQPTGATDPNTGDPYMIIDFKPSGSPIRQFIRLQVTMP